VLDGNFVVGTQFINNAFTVILKTLL